MEIGIYLVIYHDRPLDSALKYVSKIGYKAVELLAAKNSSHLDIDKILKGGATAYKKNIEKYGLFISALSNHNESKIVLGPLDHSTDNIYKGTPAEKVRYGIRRMKKTAEAAASLDVPIVVGLVGTPHWSTWYIPPSEEIFEKNWQLFAERWGEILDHFAAQGVRFANEVHLNMQTYNIETTEKALKVLNYKKEFGICFDPSHFFVQFIDPVTFIKNFGPRIYYSHAKDAEIVEEDFHIHGIPQGPLKPGKGVRFRVPGWGQVPWNRIFTAFAEVGYDYVVSYEHEDPVISREDGCEKCIAFLKPKIIKQKLDVTPWWYKW